MEYLTITKNKNGSVSIKDTITNKLLLAWLTISFFDIALNNIHGAQYLPLNFFALLAEGVTQ